MSINKILCYFRKHKYVSLHKYSENCEKIKCSNCKKEFGLHHELKILVDWDRDMENSYQFLINNKWE